MNPELRNKTLLTWERFYPGCTEDIVEIFGTARPNIGRVAKWKNKWYQTTPYQFALSGVDYEWGHKPNDKIKEEIEVTARRVGIHQYFWDFYVARCVDRVDHGTSITHTTTMTPTVSFYKEEHLVMFKLAWR